MKKTMQCGLILATLLGGWTVAASPAAAAEPITDNNQHDRWGSRHGTLSAGNLLWIRVDGGIPQDVYQHDGTNASLVQAYDGNEVEATVFGLGSGASAGEVLGAWRRGTDFAWLWVNDGNAPVEIDTSLANPYENNVTNPEALAVGDGCVFMVFQAFDPDSNENVKIVHQVDVVTGDPITPLSTTAIVPGPDRVRTSECRAAWVLDAGQQPLQLQFYPGCGDASCVETLDAGDLDKAAFDLSGGKIVYTKAVDGVDRVFLLETGAVSPTPFRLSLDDAVPARAPQTDGRHVAWLEENLDGSVDIVLLGGVRLTGPATRPGAAQNREFPFALDQGQLIWLDGQARLRYLAGNTIETVNAAPALVVEDPWLDAGSIAWYGNDAGADDEVFLHSGTPPTPDAPPPPLLVKASARDGAVTVSWSEVLGAASYNLYYAEEPGVTKDTYAGLIGGTKVAGATSPYSLNGAADGTTYYFAVSTVEAAVEGPSSGQASVFVKTLWVDSTADSVDANPGDGRCMDSSGACTLRAAVQEAGALNLRATVRVPAGIYTLALGGSGEDLGATGDLDITGELIVVGDGAGATVIDGAQLDAVFHVDPAATGLEVEVSDVTIRNGAQGIVNRGHLSLDRVAVEANGSLGSFLSGAGISSFNESLSLVDCVVAGNRTSSHGGGLFLGGRVLIQRSEIGDNIAGIGGGGIYNLSAELTVIDSVIHHNSSRHSQNWSGGGIFNEGNEISLVRSTIHDNESADCGGGLYNEAGGVFLVNSTISANTADNSGGGICNRGFSAGQFGFLQLSNVTIRSNGAASGGGGLSNETAFTSVTVRNTIIADSVDTANCGGTTSTISSLGYNLDSGNTCNFGQASDVVNADPLAGPLADNGGATPTHALPADSPAVDGGDPLGCRGPRSTIVSLDQRGGQRPHDGDADGIARCDIGAFELLGPCSDTDGDGFGAPGNPACTVAALPDCDDSDPSVYPGAAQVCDGVNNDCMQGSWPALAGTGEQDEDGDGLATCQGDCDDTNEAAWATPDEARWLGFSDPRTLEWWPPLAPGASSVSYDVLRSPDPADFADAAVCVESLGIDTVATDAADPLPGEVLHFLVRAVNACPGGTGSLGTDSSGTARNGRSCLP